MQHDTAGPTGRDAHSAFSGAGAAATMAPGRRSAADPDRRTGGIDAIAVEGPIASDTKTATPIDADFREWVTAAASFLSSMASPHRLLILCLVCERPYTVTELCEVLGARQSLISQHLTRLRLDRLVASERHGNFVRYSLAPSPAREIVAVLHAHYSDIPRSDT